MIRTYFLFLILAVTGCTIGTANGPGLKYVIYDFDGLDVGQSALPDGDYGNNDLSYQVAANPLAHSDVLGDRVLGLSLHWQAGIGEFGKGMSRFIELNAAADYLNFYFYNPLGNDQSANLEIVITEDDNSNNSYEYTADDDWSRMLTIPVSQGWQLFSVPLSSFVDSNTGGNGLFDAAYTGQGGMLFKVGFIFSNPGATGTTANYYMDMICFSEGVLPTGATPFDLPTVNNGSHCLLGALSASSPQLIPQEVEGFFQPGKKLNFASWFLYYSSSGTTPDVYPGNEVADLLHAGYRPVITWEMMYEPYARLDPVQPRLDKILDGTFDWYIDAFADRIKSYNDTVVMRIFHEFEGDWYSWSLTENNHDPNIYIAAYRHVVDRFNARGATRVLWMWCLNAETKPYLGYNWVVSAYPGDAYVDIVATDIYNHPDPGIPDWKSFRYTAAESYYYLRKYFPQKPLFICEVGCRERVTGEDVTSQTKADWICEMDRELKSYFSEVKALIFFSVLKEHDWRINSSQQAQDAVGMCLWSDPYYGGNFSFNSSSDAALGKIYPNPFFGETILVLPETGTGETIVDVYEMTGKKVLSILSRNEKEIHFGKELDAGTYAVRVSNAASSGFYKIVKVLVR